MTISPAYAAGLIDGEGWIGSGFRKSQIAQRTYYTARVTIGMTVPGMPALSAMHGRWGGSLTVARKQSERWEQAWAWTAQGIAARALLEEILPYLLVKRPQALAALDLERVKSECQRLPNGRPMWTAEAEARCLALKEELHRLNLKGPAIAQIAGAA